MSCKTSSQKNWLTNTTIKLHQIKTKGKEDGTYYGSTLHVETNIGQKFFQLIKKHFPPSNKYSKIFNKNTIKLSYSCSPNIGMIFKQMNNTLFKNENQKSENAIKNKCNCKQKEKCPLNRNCLQKVHLNLG